MLWCIGTVGESKRMLYHQKKAWKSPGVQFFTSLGGLSELQAPEEEELQE